MIAKQIEGIQKMIRLHGDDDGPEEKKEEKRRGITIQINPAMKRHWELEIKTLREAPRDPDKLRKMLKEKQREWEEDTMKIDVIERLVTEMEMLQFVLCAVLSYNSNKQ